MTNSFFSSSTMLVPCTIEIEQTPESLHAHVTLESDIEARKLRMRRIAEDAYGTLPEADRAAFAVAIATSPRILLCDEPTGEVDQLTESAIVGLLKELQKEGAAIVVATHSVVLASHADRLLHLSDGLLT